MGALLCFPITYPPLIDLERFYSIQSGSDTVMLNYLMLKLANPPFVFNSSCSPLGQL